MSFLDTLLGRGSAAPTERRSGTSVCAALLDHLVALPVPRKPTQNEMTKRSDQQFIVQERILDLGSEALDDLLAVLGDRAWGRLTATERERVGTYHVIESRAFVVNILGRLRDSRAVPALIAESREGLRHNALLSLASIGDPAAVASVVAALSDRNAGADVRRGAAFALGGLRSPESVMPLIEALGDDDEHVRGNAIKSLGRLGDQRAVAPLRALLKEHSGDQHDRILIALGRLGDESVRAEIVARASDRIEGLTEALNELGEYRLARSRAILALRTSGSLRQGPPEKWAPADPASPRNQLVRTWWNNFRSNLETAANTLWANPDDSEQVVLVKQGLTEMVEAYGRRDVLNRVESVFSLMVRSEIEEELERVRKLAENLR